jgi:riboflavin synthase
MFTGIVLGLGEIVSKNTKSGMTELGINCKSLYCAGVQIGLGDSIAINGICLTVVRMQEPNLFFDVSGQTVISTNIGKLNIGSKVNLEPAMSANGRFGGHIVSGHVDGTGKISSIKDMGNGIIVKINTSDDILRYVIKKGSITVDGIGLTVVDVFDDGFSLVIIPHTSLITTLSIKKAGDTVNLEADVLAKYVEKFVSNITNKTNKTSDDANLLNKLTDGGFIR